MTGDRTGQAIRWSTVAAVAVVAGVAGWASYEHEYTWLASLASPAWLRASTPAPRLARWLLAAGITATLAANIAAGVRYGYLGAVVAAWPTPALIGSCELLMWLVRTVAGGTMDSNAM